MKARTCFCWLAAALLCLLVHPQPADASFIETIGQGSRATSLGTAFIGVADDLSALYYNPAGLTQLIGGKTMDQALGLRMTHLQMFISEPVVDERSGIQANEEYKFSDKFPFWAYEPYLPFGFEIGDRIYLAPLPILVPFEGSVQFRDGSGGPVDPTRHLGDARFSSAEAAEIFITLSPTVAFKVTPWLSVGAGFDLMLLTDLFQKSMIGNGATGRAAARYLADTLTKGNRSSKLWADIYKAVLPLTSTSTPDHRDDAYLQIIPDQQFPTGLKPVNDASVDLETYGFHVGVMFFPTEFIRLGVTYRSAMTPTIKGTAYSQFSPDILEKPIYKLLGLHNDNDRFSLKYPLPQIVGAGGSIKITDQWMWCIDWTWVDWHSAMEETHLHFYDEGLVDTGLADGYKNIYIPRNWRSVHSVRSGIEYKPVQPLVLTAGIWYDPSPTPDSTWTPHDDPGDRLTYSGGIAVNGLFDGLLDIGTHVQWITVFERVISRGESANLGGAREQEMPDANGTLNPGYVPNTDFTMNEDTEIINWGFTFTLHI